ncbi:MAG TPA: phospholipase D family protein [Thermoanaerobaculia bacterium]|nr:phospholipase D family protein [Thermoanaerobaculia bacterium]
MPRDRVLIVSPFLSARTLERLTDKRHENVLVSVAPSLNDVGHKATGLFNRVAVLGDRAEPEPAEDQPAPSTDDLSGLHAKLFVFDQGWNAELWTGSANATEAAFSKNVEFLVGFTGKKSVCGVDAILGPRQGVTSLSDLLVPYQAGQEKSTNLPTEAEELLDQVRLDLVKLGLRVSVEPDAGTGVYFLRLLAPNGATLPANRPVDVTCWPVSIPSGRAQLLPSTGVGVRFGPVGVDGITSFVAFQVTAEIGDGRASTTFVLNLPIDGAPGDRKERLLRFVLKDSAGVARFIALLLSPDGDDSISVAEPGARTAGQNGAGTGSCEPRLFEQLVQALHRSPERLDAIARLIEELGKDPDHDSLFPKGFELIWPPIWAARQGLKA